MRTPHIHLVHQYALREGLGTANLLVVVAINDITVNIRVGATRGGPTLSRALPIPRTKNSPHENWKRHTAKILMGLGGFHDTESVSTVRSNFARNEPPTR